MKEFYSNLKKKRQSLGLSLSDIHLKTRLPLQYLEAIEAGQIDQLPQAYGRIYLRRYIREIGLDPEEVLRDHDLLTGKLTPTEANEAKHIAEGKKITHPAPMTSVKESIDEVNLDKVNNYFWVGFIALLFIVGGIFVYRQYISESNQTPTTVKEIPIGELMERTGQTDSSTMEQLTDTAIIDAGEGLPPGNIANIAPGNPQGPLKLDLLSLNRVWVREIKDQTDSTEYILPKGGRHSLSARTQVELVIGRADALEIWLNDSNLGVMGSQNQVARVVINQNGIQRKSLINTQSSTPQTEAN